MAQYREGRATVTLDSDIVAGTDTAWLSNVATGDIFLIQGDEVPYRVAAVLTDTSLRLAARYAAPTETAVFYSITRDFTEFLDLPIIRVGDVDAVPIFAEALIQLDSKLRGGAGGGGSISLGGLTDVTVTGAIPGDEFTMLPGGTFGFVRPTPFTITFDHAAGDGGRIFQGYANGTVTARRIKASGGTVTENPDDITINIPPPGEANILATAGSAQSQTLVVAKSGTTLRTKGLRAGTNVTLTPEGNDLVIASTGGGGGGTVTYTMAPIGTGFSLVAPPSGTELRVKTLILDSHFTASEHASGGLSVVLNPLSVTDISTIQWSNIASGQVLTRNASSQIVGTTLPAPGIASVFADKTPQLGGPLTITGQRIVGMPVAFSMGVARPRAKSYTVVMSCPAAVRLDSLTGVTAAGNLSFRVDIGAVPDSTPEGTPASNLQGNLTSTRATVTATTPIAVDPSQQIIMTVSGVSADIDDLAFTINGVTV